MEKVIENSIVVVHKVKVPILHIVVHFHVENVVENIVVEPIVAVNDVGVVLIV